MVLISSHFQVESCFIKSSTSSRSQVSLDPSGIKLADWRDFWPCVCECLQCRPTLLVHALDRIVPLPLACHV